jgi:hypothetical protein
MLRIYDNRRDTQQLESGIGGIGWFLARHRTLYFLQTQQYSSCEQNKFWLNRHWLHGSEDSISRLVPWSYHNNIDRLQEAHSVSNKNIIVDTWHVCQNFAAHFLDFRSVLVVAECPKHLLLPLFPIRLPIGKFFRHRTV